MKDLPVMKNGTRYCLYRDPAYPILEQLIAPYPGNGTPDQHEFNKAMSKVRQSVEYGFGKVETYWAFCDFNKNLKLYLQPVGKLYIVATFLTNCHTCLYGCNVNSLFESHPPSLEDYVTV